MQHRLLIRDVNDRIREINAAFAAVTDTYEVLCECGREGCLQRIDVSPSVYEEMRRQGQFIVAKAHADAGRDEVVTGDDSYAIVAPAA